MNWLDCRDLFEPDGSLRDLYVLNTGTEDWQRLIDYLRESEYSCQFTINEEIASLPTDVGLVFKERDEAPPSLFVDAGGLQLHCHFFWPEEIEFDLDPCEISGPQAFESLICFMKDIGDAVAKDVLLTLENMPSIALLRYDVTSSRIVNESGT